jgi:AbiU2
MVMMRTLPALEGEYKRNFDLIAGQISGATRAFYTYMEINKFASESKQNYAKINRDGHFWSGQLYALQTTWFIVLGRIFDPTRGAYSIHDFLKSTVTYKGLFSRAALAERKRLAAGQSQPEWLDDFLKSAWEPRAADLERIRSTIEKSDTKWKNIYQPIRNKLFAHIDINAAVADLFRDTLVGDIEDILYDLNKLRTAVFQLLENGREYWIEENDRRYADPFLADTRALLSHL